MRISDGSSYVCSSDLVRLKIDTVVALPARLRLVPPRQALALRPGLAVRIGRRAVVEHAPVSRPGKGTAQVRAGAIRPVRLPRAGLIVALCGIGAAINPAAAGGGAVILEVVRSEEHTSELQSLMRHQ